jgi:16S rRNA (uracil1498-N3)-methyltransferase
MHDEDRAGEIDPADLLRDAAGFVYVDNLEDPQLSLEDAHHLLNVLRLRRGEVVVAADGEGSYVACEVNVVQTTGRGRNRPSASAAEVLTVLSEAVRVDPPGLSAGVAFAMPKGERADWTVQKLTELGIDVIVPLMSDRSVVRLDRAECARRGERFRRIAKEAGSQSRRTRLPTIPDPVSFAGYLATHAEPADELAIAEPGGAPLGAATRSILVGPEGGWSSQELAAVSTRVGMGETILRAETAAIVAGTLLVERRWGKRS